MNKQQLLENLNKDIYCRIGVSSIHGVGVIAIRDIPKGTNPFIGSCQCDYITFTQQEIEHLPQGVKDMLHDFYIEKEDKVLVPTCGLNGMDISYFMNFAEDPTVSSPDEGITFVTNRDLKKGEELTLNYTKDYGEDNTV